MTTLNRLQNDTLTPNNVLTFHHCVLSNSEPPPLLPSFIQYLSTIVNKNNKITPKSQVLKNIDLAYGT